MLDGKWEGNRNSTNSINVSMYMYDVLCHQPSWYKIPDDGIVSIYIRYIIFSMRNWSVDHQLDPDGDVIIPKVVLTKLFRINESFSLLWPSTVLSRNIEFIEWPGNTIEFSYMIEEAPLWPLHDPLAIHIKPSPSVRSVPMVFPYHGFAYLYKNFILRALHSFLSMKLHSVELYCFCEMKNY